MYHGRKSGSTVEAKGYLWNYLENTLHLGVYIYVEVYHCIYTAICMSLTPREA